MSGHSIHSRRAGRRTGPGMTPPALAVLAVAALLTAGCISKARYTQVEQERDLCTTRYEQLQKQVENANRTGEVLQAKVASLQTQGEQLDSMLRQREEEATKLQETYDGLVVSLKEELKAGQIEVKQLRDGLRVNVAQDILFDSGSAALDGQGIEVLHRVASQLKRSSHQIVVTGHTDNKPIGPALIRLYPTNWELAGARAASVVRLFSDSGLPGRRLLAVSMADLHPVASNKTPEGRARNRRIEIRLRPAPAEE